MKDNGADRVWSDSQVKRTLMERIADGLASHVKHDKDYFERGISHHKEVADRLKMDIAESGDNQELRRELQDRLDDTMGDIGRMEKELNELNRVPPEGVDSHAQ